MSDGRRGTMSSPLTGGWVRGMDSEFTEGGKGRALAFKKQDKKRAPDN